MPGEADVELTSDRDEALADERLFLLGLEQPLVQELLRTAVALPADKRALLVRDGQPGTRTGVWDLRLQHADGRSESLLLDGTIPPSGGVRFTPYAPSRLERFSPPGRLEHPTADCIERHATDCATGSAAQLPRPNRQTAVRQFVSSEAARLAGGNRVSALKSDRRLCMMASTRVLEVPSMHRLARRSARTHQR